MRPAMDRLPAPLRPRMRGVLHQYAFDVAAVAGTMLVLAADGTRARVAAGVYAVGLTGLLGTSALYHRVTWSANARRWMRRLDHSMIFVLIAATATPIALLVMSDPLRTVLLAVVWGGAGAGVLLNMAWPSAPKPVTAAVYLAVGWAGVAGFPQLAGVAWPALALLLAGGLLYSAGAIVYALERPNPVPAVFGYHEVFHALVCAAAALHFVAVGVVVL
jgi:hemolysin III